MRGAIIKFLLSFEGLLVKAEKAAVVALIAFMVFFSFAQVLLRIIFHSGIVWLDPLLRHMVLWAGMLGAAIAARYASHFALEAFVKMAPEKYHRPLEVFSSLFTGSASLLLCHAAFKFIKDEFSAGSVAFYIDSFPVPGGWAEIVIPLAFLLIAFHSFAGIFRDKEAQRDGI